jgi:site-specific recombinase XerD
MQQHHPKNERIKRDYFEYMKEARGHSEQSIDAIAAALDRFERFTKFADFRDFRKDQAIDFKEHLSSQVNAHQAGVEQGDHPLDPQRPKGVPPMAFARTWIQIEVQMA